MLILFSLHFHFLLLLQVNRLMKKQPHTFKPNLKQRTRARQKRSIVIKHVPQILTTFSLCSTLLQTSSLQTTFVAVACTNAYGTISSPASCQECLLHAELLSPVCNMSSTYRDLNRAPSQQMAQMEHDKHEKNIENRESDQTDKHNKLEF